MTNTEVLKELIRNCGYKMKYVAEYLGLSGYGLQLKMENKQEFKTSEITALCELLRIESLEQKEYIFFAKEDDLKSSEMKEVV